MHKQALKRCCEKISNADFVFFCSDKKRRAWLLRDIFDDETKLDKQRIERIKFHIKKNDYFGTLATILDLIVQDETLDKNKFLKKFSEDLLYLQKNYIITKK